MPSLTPPFNTAQLSPTEQLLKDLGCEYTRRADGVLVVKGDIDLSNKGLTVLPDLSAVVVEGSFFCLKNQLISLAGTPQSVGGSFFCFKNRLTSLAGAPPSVGGDFFCHSNQLTSLTGAPQSVGGSFSCSGNQLTSLAGMPQKFGKIISDLGDFFSLGEIPEDLRQSPETRARLQREAEEEHQKYLRDTDASLGLRREMPLPKRIDWKKFRAD